MRKVLGMGNALTDMLLNVENEMVLQQLNLQRGGMHLVNIDEIDLLHSYFDFSKAVKAAGGSAANTAYGVSKLGGKASFFGKIAQDDIGDFFLQDMLKNLVKPYFIIDEHQASGSSNILVSEDGERTMCTYLGVSGDLKAEDLSPELFQVHDIFHVEGYLVQNHKLIRTAVKMAKEAGCMVSIDLASFNVVEDHLEFLQSITKDYVDIVFANEEEAFAFTQKHAYDAAETIAQMADIAIVKMGSKGSIVQQGNQNFLIQAYTANCIDTTGAGDLYAAGFLYGLSINLPLQVCGEIGSWVASQVVEVIGAKIPDERWEHIKNHVQTIIANS